MAHIARTHTHRRHTRTHAASSCVQTKTAAAAAAMATQDENNVLRQLEQFCGARKQNKRKGMPGKRAAGSGLLQPDSQRRWGWHGGGEGVSGCRRGKPTKLHGKQLLLLLMLTSRICLDGN